MILPASLRPWLPWARVTDRPRLRILAFPFAGGGASIYRPWLDSFPTDIDVLPVQLPGRENRINETPLTQLDQVADVLMTALAPLLNRPLVLFGWSMGALIAHALALRLTARTTPPELLMVGAHAAPQLPAIYPPLHHLSGDAFWNELRRYQGVPDAVLEHAELRALIEPMALADFRIVEVRTPPALHGLTCPIAAIGGAEDPWVPAERLRPWRDMTTGPFSLTQIPGHHFLITQTPTVLRQTVLELL